MLSQWRKHGCVKMLVLLLVQSPTDPNTCIVHCNVHSMKVNKSSSEHVQTKT